MIKKLNEELQSWDKLESASAIYYMYGWNKKKKSDDEKSKNENEDYRDCTQGERNAKYLKKARFYANTPKARLNRERTELKKELNGH